MRKYSLSGMPGSVISTESKGSPSAAPPWARARFMSASGASRVERCLEDLAGLEREHPARADGDLLAGLRVATDARVLLAHHEVAKARDLDLLAALEGLLDGVEDRLDDLGR